MYFGGPIYDTWEKFAAYYAGVKKYKKDYAPEDVMLNGIALTNLPHVVIDPKKGVSYSPTATIMIDKDLINEIVKYSSNAGIDLSYFINERSII